MRVQLYRNLNKSREYNVWSLAAAKAKLCAMSTGKLYKHADVVLLEDCCLVVNEKGRQRVLRERSKNVHAWVEGELVDMAAHPSEYDPDVLPDEVYDGRWIPITYNPYKYDTFMRADSGKPVTHAQLVAATPSGIMAQGLSSLRGLPGLAGLFGLGALPLEDWMMNG
ncbi:MAG TPA: hypothetical protein VIY27_09100 [Myxococcota bacterium]